MADVKNVIERYRDPVAARKILVVNDQSQGAAAVRQRFGHADIALPERFSWHHKLEAQHGR